MAPDLSDATVAQIDRAADNVGVVVKNRVFPHTTYYEFVTFHSGAASWAGHTVKCTSTVRGAQNGTTTRGCKFKDGGADLRPAYETS